MLQQITPFEWLRIEQPIRVKIAEALGIPKSAGTILEDNTVKSDGHTYADLAHLTVEKMQAFLKSVETDFELLLNQIVEGFKKEMEEVKVVPPDPKMLLLEEWATVLNRVKTQAAGLDMLPHLQETIKQLFEIKNEPTKTRLSVKKVKAN